MATSARPSAISRAAVPIASMDDAQAVQMVICGPCSPYRMASWAAAMFGQILMTVLRSMASGPPVSSWYWPLASARMPPMLVPCTTAVRRGSNLVRPACRTACSAQARANWAKRSRCRASLRARGFKQR